MGKPANPPRQRIASAECSYRETVLLSVRFCNSATGVSSRNLLQEPQGFRRLRANCVIGVDLRRPDQALRINDVTRRHRQAIFRFVMKPVEGAPERLVEAPQVIGKSEDQAELLSCLEMKITEDIEG